MYIEMRGIEQNIIDRVGHVLPSLLWPGPIGMNMSPMEIFGLEEEAESVRYNRSMMKETYPIMRRGLPEELPKSAPRYISSGN